MAAIYASTVEETRQFSIQAKALAAKYSAIANVIKDFKELLILDYQLPEVLIDADEMPDVYSVKLDYPPHGSAGKGILLATYHKPVGNPSMVAPYRKITLLTLVDLDS